MSREWSEWRRFPDPRQFGILVAPFGPGCYELRNGDQLVLYGKGRNVASRMTSLLPRELGCGTRNNRHKREYVFAHIGSIEYRTMACATSDEATNQERVMQSGESAYLFPD
jgi:hypothetical protein